MKLFQSTQKSLAFGGFIKNQPAFNRTQLRMMFLSILFLGLQCIYLFHVANTPRQYMDSIFMTTVGILVFIAFVSSIFNTTAIFDLIYQFEETISKSECFRLSSIRFDCEIEFAKIVLGLKYPKSKALYEKTNRQVELISKIIQFVVLYVSPPVLVLPNAIICLFMYFTTDLGNDAFNLPFPTW